MSQLACVRCKETISAELDQCPHCGERVTAFQRTYSDRLLDGKYQILDRLGVGGMGEIFKVRHIHLNELRVIKIMRPNVAADDQGLQRFLQEARTSTMIKHKNLAMLYDFAQLEDGSYYMVWEFIDGTNIQRWTSDHGAMPPRLTVEIAVQALSGLDHLHSMGLIHRDISPENIMLSQDHHGKLLVKVIDFGIAKQLQEGDSGHGLTQTGMFLGKLKYASPEQAGFLKDDEHLDARSDLYSFGIVMYEMLAGKAPFTATNPHGYILKHVTEKPLPIAEISPGVRVPAELESMVMLSLEKSRDQRFANAAAFIDALETIRTKIPPDNKYGLGEKLITLSGAKTLSELPKFTGSFTGGGTVPAPTQSSAPTVAERTIDPKTMAGEAAPTLIERVGAPGGSPRTESAGMPTLVGRDAAPTVVEKRGQWNDASAEPTVVERKFTPDEAPKKKTGLYAGLAAAAVVAVAGGAFFMSRKAPEPAPAVAVTSTASASAVPPAGSAPPMQAGRGALLLSASPWGEVETIVNDADKSNVTVPEDGRSTPLKIELAPGKYTVTLTGPHGKKNVDVAIEAGKKTPQHVDMEAVDVDALAKEMNQ